MKKRKFGIGAIRIPEAFKAPGEAAMARKREMVASGRIPVPVVTADGMLVDGYAGLLALAERGDSHVTAFVHDGPAVLAVGKHDGCGKEYAWWVSPVLHLGEGDAFLADTRFGPKQARAVRLEECSWDEAFRHRRALRRLDGDGGEP